MKTLTRGHIRTGLDSVRGAKGRSFWSLLGVVIGVTSVITIVSIGEGIKTQISQQLLHMGSNVIIVRPSQLKTGSSPNSDLNIITGSGISSPLTSHDVTVVQTTSGVAASSPLTIIPGTVKADNGIYNGGYVIGATHDLPSLLNQSMLYGNFWDHTAESSNVAVLGEQAAIDMFKIDVPLGHTFSFHGQPFIVDGVFNEFTSTPLGQEANFNDAIFIPNEVGENMTNSTAPTYAILARGGSSTTPTALAATVSSALASAHGGLGGFSVLTAKQSNAQNNGILNLLTRLIAGVATISLLVGGIGIMNVMLVSVSERLHEIGIRKAIGATNRQIMSQFLVESSFLSLVGGLIGIILALLIDLGLRAATNLTPEISAPLVAIAAGVAFGVGIVFGTAPAVKAARKDPISALRSE